MNCKPNDLAIIVRSGRHPELLGRIVTVLYECPLGEWFKLPDGVSHEPVGSRDGLPRWVCAFANPINAPYGLQDMVVTRETVFAPIPDACLKPIPGQSDDDAVESPISLPTRDEVTA